MKRKRGRPRAQASVLAAVLDLLGNSDVRAVTMEAIAERAGISKVTLYRRWPSKAALMADALAAQLKDLVPLDPDQAPLLAITEHVHGLGRALEGQVGQVFRIVASECILEPGTLDEFRNRYVGQRRLAVTRIIRRGMRDGTITMDGRAVDCHDMLFGTLFYRFLFGFGPMSQASLTKLLTSTLQPTPPTPAVEGS